MTQGTDNSPLCVGMFGPRFRLWDAAASLSLAVLRGHTGTVSSAVFSADSSRVATASDDNTARIWDATSGRSLRFWPM